MTTTTTTTTRKATTRKAAKATSTEALTAAAPTTTTTPTTAGRKGSTRTTHTVDRAGGRQAKAARTEHAGQTDPRIPAAHKAAKERKDAPKECTCGCGGETRGGLFMMGHDARLKGVLIRMAEGRKPRPTDPDAVPAIAVERRAMIGFLATMPALAGVVAAAAGGRA